MQNNAKDIYQQVYSVKSIFNDKIVIYLIQYIDVLLLCNLYMH